MKKAAKGQATCATTAGYVYQAWPKGKPVPKRGAKSRIKSRPKKR